jgi:hypothetical protein
MAAVVVCDAADHFGGKTLDVSMVVVVKDWSWSGTCSGNRVFVRRGCVCLCVCVFVGCLGCVCADGLIRAGGLRVEVVWAGYVGVGDFNVEALLCGMW